MEIKISKDMKKYKSKDIGIFTFKEAAYIAVGCVAAYVTYKFTGSFEIAMIPMAVILVFGFLKPFGMSFAKFFGILMADMSSPRTYINETDFIYEPEDYNKTYDEEIQEFNWEAYDYDVSTNYKYSKYEKEKFI